MRLGLFIATILLATICYGQSDFQKDSLISEMCKAIESNKHLSDSANVENMYETQLYPFLWRFPEETRDETATNLYFRIQRSCQAFLDILNRANPSKGGEIFVDEKPVSNLKKDACRKFIGNKEYYYIETTGDTVVLQLTKKYWIDHFNDGTYSKLKLEWIDNCELELEFIESNNLVRRNYSKKGDKYRYIILNSAESYYELSTEVVGQEKYFIYKVYK